MDRVTPVYSMFRQSASRLFALRGVNLTLGLAGLGLIIGLVFLLPNLLAPLVADRCRSARPAVQLVLEKDITPGSGLASNLADALANSPQLTLRQKLTNGCQGVPEFVLQISREPGPDRIISVRLVDAATADIAWNEAFRPEPTPGYEPDAIMAARIAYRLAEPSGVIAAKAGTMHWSNDVAFQEFKCLQGTNLIYFAASRREADAVYDCMGQYAVKSSEPNMAAQFVALDAYRNQPAFNSGYFILSEKGSKALARVEAQSPLDRELLGLKLRQDRLAKPMNVAHIAEIFTTIDEQYPYDPVIQAFAAMTCAAYLDDYGCAYKRTHLANLIAPEAQTLSWGRIFANVAQQRWPDLVQDRDQIMGFSFVEDALIAQAMAPYGPSPDVDRNAARAWLARDHLDFVPRLRDRIAKLEYSNAVKMALFDIIQTNYDQEPLAADQPQGPSNWAMP